MSRLSMADSAVEWGYGLEHWTNGIIVEIRCSLNETFLLSFQLEIVGGLRSEGEIFKTE